MLYRPLTADIPDVVFSVTSLDLAVMSVVIFPKDYPNLISIGNGFGFVVSMEEQADIVKKVLM